MFVVAGRDGTEMLDPVEEPFDPVAELVDAGAECGLLGSVVEWADVGIGALIGDLCPQRITVVAAVCEQDVVGRKRAQHVLAALAVVGLALRQLERDREAVAVDDRVDLGRKPAAGTSHATAPAAFFSPLAAC